MKILEEASGFIRSSTAGKPREAAENLIKNAPARVVCSEGRRGKVGGDAPGIKTLEGLGEKVWDGGDVREDMTDLQQESRRDGGEEEGRLRANTKISISILEFSSHDLKALHH